jgi:hypothetical protein
MRDLKFFMFDPSTVYRMLVSTRRRREAWLENKSDGSNQVAEENLWLKTWKVNVPSKLKVFLWRLTYQSLPPSDVYHHRRTTDTSACSICGMTDSWRQSLLEYTVSRCVWAGVDEDITQPATKQWIFTMTETRSHESFVQLAISLWEFWYARRRMIHDGKQQSALSTLKFVCNFLDDLDMVPSMSSGRHVIAAKEPAPRWIVHTLGMAKVNVMWQRQNQAWVEPSRSSVEARQVSIWEPHPSLLMLIIIAEHKDMIWMVDITFSS